MKHGLSKTVGYRTWYAMLQRCQNPRNPVFRRYGGRGITVCDRWQSFENFYADMGSRPTPKHSIDRIDNNGNYEPGNCRWATPHEQARNRGDNYLIEWRGETRCLSDWCEVVGLTYSTVKGRLDSGWSVERALTADIPEHVAGSAHTDTEETCELGELVQGVWLGAGQFHSLARQTGLGRSTVSGVLQGKRGASLETLRKLSEASGVELGKLTEYVEAQRKGRTTK